MINDSKEAVIKLFNTQYHHLGINTFNGVYKYLKIFASKNGKQSRITDYNHVDMMNKGNTDVVEMQQKNRIEGNRFLLELWVRAKEIKKLHKAELSDKI